MNYKGAIENTYNNMSAGLKNAFIPFEDNNYQPTFLQSKWLFYAVIFLLLVKITIAGFFVPFAKNIFYADITKIELVNLLNQDRQQMGLNTLTESKTLDQAAQLKAQDMVLKDYFAHQSPQGITPWFWFRQVGYNYKYAGENLAVGYFNSSQVFQAWLNSPSHKANLQNPNYKEVGTAVVSGFGQGNDILVVQLFGSLPAKKIPSVISKSATGAKPTSQKIIPPSLIATPNTNVTINNSSSVTTQKVLGSETQINIIPAPVQSPKNTPYGWLVHFLVYDYQVLLLYASYGLLIIVSVALLVNMMVNFDIQREKLILKSLLLIAVLSAVVFLHNDIIGYFLPHQIFI